MIDIEGEIKKACEEVGVEWESIDEMKRVMIEKCFRTELQRAETVRSGMKFEQTYRELAIAVARRLLRVWLNEAKSGNEA